MCISYVDYEYFFYDWIEFDESIFFMGNKINTLVSTNYGYCSTQIIVKILVIRIAYPSSNYFAIITCLINFQYLSIIILSLKIAISCLHTSRTYHCIQIFFFIIVLNSLRNNRLYYSFCRL